ncbi:hypothetical protein [Caballeronia sp. LZ001]|uniref:hypothetical protein n=1 Tax=Caballeronia sp. LZ001 TaxID=3038553 RepID=UPI0028637CBB|nr:hypothetical protein [Caballeronia sp. LZ001]MDR5801184.1 hypothetical protein [Caballeronia sp. LZ001]
MMLACFLIGLVVWLVVGAVSPIWLAIRSGHVTGEDLVMSVFCSFMGPIALLMVLAHIGAEFTIWRRK